MNQIESKLKAEEEQRQESRWRFHWQNLKKCDHCKRGWPSEGRCCWHFGNRNSIEFSWNLWTHFFGIGLDWDDEDVTLMLACPPVAFWLSISSWWPFVKRLLPHGVLNAVTYPDTIVVDERDISVRIFDWMLWIHPYCHKNDWASKDPWWVKGVSFNLNPFRWHHNRTEVQCMGTTYKGVPFDYWESAVNSWDRDKKEPDHRTIGVYAYPYWLKNGTVQQRTATCHIERMAWRPKCLRWTGLIEKVRTYLDIRFDDEVGERSGSWKGGTTGCSFEIRKGETMRDCLERMESERKFD